MGEVLADEALEHARYLAGLAQRINDHDPALSHDDEAQAADSDLSSIAVWLKARAQEWLAAPTTNAPDISTSLVDAELDRLIDEYRTDVINGARMGDLQFWRHADESRAALHAHVAQVKREAREDERRTVAAEAMRIVRRMEAQRGAASESPALAPKESL